MTFGYTYDIWLVGLSYVVAVLSSYISILIIKRFLSLPKGMPKNVWHLAGAVTLGGGIWSMHFVAMLAMQMNMEVLYDSELTVISILFSIIASGFVYWFISNFDNSLKNLLLAGTVLGASIGGMHYTGMAAMQMNAVIYYNPFIFAASIVVAVFLSTVSVWLIYFNRGNNFKLNLKIITALVMGLAVSLMHYTGMAATNFISVPAQLLSGFTMSGQQLPWFVGR